MDERTSVLEEKDKEYVWHPFTQMKEWLADTPLIIEKGNGSYIYDTKGRKYIDGVSSIWVNIHGHRKKEIDRAIEGQLKKIAHSTLLGLSNIPSILLAEKLIKLAHDSGLFSETIRIHSPDCYRCPLGKRHPDCDLACTAEADTVLKRHHHEIAAIIVEPLVQAAAGMIVSPPGYISRINSICKKYDVLFIADEVATGFGRTGRMFACEHEEINPDIMAVAKGITGGYLPLAATLVTVDIYNAFLGEYKEFKTFFHGHSYTGNPLGCAAAIANIDIFEQEKVLDQVRVKSSMLEKLLAPLKDHPHVGDIRQKGLMAGIELVQNKTTKTPYPLEDRIGFHVCLKARDMGLILRPIGNVIVIMPPLSISTAALKKIVSIISDAIDLNFS